MIIPQWECKKDNTINPQQVINLRVDQGTFRILTISCTCGGCGKQQIVTGITDSGKQPAPQQKGKKGVKK